MSDWRYFAQRFDGNGNLGDFVDMNLPLRGVEIEEILSGHNSLSAQISPEYAPLMGPDGLPVFKEWGVCLWAESPTGEVYGGILESSGLDGATWSLDCVDLSGVMIECPFDDATYFVDVDPIDIFRWIWQWYQSRPGCNLSVNADGTRSPVLLGANYVQVEDYDQEAIEDPTPLAPSSYADNEAWIVKSIKVLFALKNAWTKAQIRSALEEWLGTSPEDPIWQSRRDGMIVARALKLVGQPPGAPGTNNATPTVDDPKIYQKDAYKLNWYTNLDLGAEIDTLASTTPFDWLMTHYWSNQSDDADLFHHIRIGYPKLGRFLSEMRFVVGENILVSPSLDRDGEDYANEVIVLGNGEGAAMLRGRAVRPHPGRMRRTVTVTDQNLTTLEQCNARAEAEVTSRSSIGDITEVTLTDHPHAPAGAVRVGDEFLLEGDIGWADLSTRVRVVGRRFSPDDASTVTLSLMRSDPVG